LIQLSKLEKENNIFKYCDILWYTTKTEYFLTIQEFCDRMRRYLVSFEHYVVVIKKNDLNERRGAKEWFSLLVEWIVFEDE